MRACLHTSVGWGPRACSGRIRPGLRVKEAPLSGVSNKGRVWGRRKGRKRKISPKVVELALTASPSKPSWHGARFGPQAGEELRPGLAEPGRVPQTHMCLPPTLTYSQSLIFALTCLYTFALCHHCWLPHYLLIFLRVDNENA